MNEASTRHPSAASPIEPKSEALASPVSAPPLYKSDPSARHTVADETATEDDSTIKCICGFKHDDGNSVFCDKCSTWQHTECYYYIEQEDRVPSGAELEAITHLCTDCCPRDLDVQAAISRQKPRVQELDEDEPKTKKTAAKGNRRKAVKAADLHQIPLTNGHTHDSSDPVGTTIATLDRTSRSPRDHLPPSKKQKTTHRPNAPPVHLQHAIPTLPTSHPHKRSTSSLQSPSKPYTSNSKQPTSAVRGPYSSEFMQLYAEEPTEPPMWTNLYSDINITEDLSLWISDPEALRAATRGFSHADVFHRMDLPLSDMLGPPPRKEMVEDDTVLIDGQHPRWAVLKSDHFTEEKTIIGELKGKIGHMKEYIQDPANRWDYLRHPAPFVFFHPKLPIYIDTRSEGTICRYLRRSCRPNLIMTTFLENESEYHFCFTAKQDIPIGAELTIGWVPDEHMRKFNTRKDDPNVDMTTSGEEYIADWVSKVLPEFGGCACGAPNDCWLSSSMKASTKARSRSSRHRPPPMLQPTAQTEDDSDLDQPRSATGSKSGSRDMTPIGPNGEIGLAPGVEISDREKRKIAALEKNFEQLENEKHLPGAKKKKRNSGGSNATTPGTGHAKASMPTAASVSQPSTPGLSAFSLAPSLASKPQYADAATSRRKSGSPTTKAPNSVGRPRTTNNDSTRRRAPLPSRNPPNPSPLSRPLYVDVAVQTEPSDDKDWYETSTKSPVSRKPYLSLTRRLLLRSQLDRRRLDERQRNIAKGHCQEHSMNEAIPTPNGTSHVSQKPRAQSGDFSAKPSEEVHTSPDSLAQDSYLNSSERRMRSRAEHETAINVSPAVTPSGESWHANGDERTKDALRLQIQATDSASPHLHASLTQTPTSTTPSTAITSVLPASSSNASHLAATISALQPQPSPAKKKVSLSDYIRRKGSHPAETKSMTDSPERSHDISRIPLSDHDGDGVAEASRGAETNGEIEQVEDVLPIRASAISAISPVAEEDGK